jgi:hypothetical protein
MRKALGCEIDLKGREYSRTRSNTPLIRAMAPRRCWKFISESGTIPSVPHESAGSQGVLGAMKPIESVEMTL